jgi:cold shock CspA family protein
MTGYVKSVISDRGFGFISQADGAPDVFFHLRAMQDPQAFTEQLIGRRVSYEPSENKGRKCAINVALQDWTQ